MEEATLRQAMKLLYLVEQQGIPLSQLQKILESGLFTDLLKAEISSIDRTAFQRCVGLRKVFCGITTDLALQALDDIAASGGSVQPIVRSALESALLSVAPNRPPFVVELVSFGNFGSDLSEEGVRQKLDAMGLVPANLVELVSLVGKFADKIKEFHIVALGSVLNPPERLSSLGYVFPTFYCHGQGNIYKNLSLAFSRYNFQRYLHFAAVSKS